MRDHATTFLAALAAIVVVYFARGFLLPIFLAIYLAIVLRPAVTRLNAVRVPEPLAAALIVVLFMGLLGGALYALAGPLQTWADRLPQLTAELRFRFHAIQTSIEEMRAIAQQIEQMTQGGDQAAGGQGANGQASGGGGGGGVDVLRLVLDRTQSALVTLLTMLVMLFFLLSQGSYLTQRLTQMLPADWHPETGTRMITEVHQQIALYLRTFTLINIGFGILVWAAMTLLGMPDAILWGVMAGVLNFLPYIGPLIMVILIAGGALLDAYTWSGILLPPLVYVGLNIVEGNLITPHLLGRQLTLNPIAIFVSVLFWTWAWGPVGALLAVPALAILGIVAEYAPPARKLLPILR